MSIYEGFSNPWEHARLLSDARRNAAMIELLARHAPGAAVLEVGCATGLLSCVAARLGARSVVAVEPTPLWEVAAALVADNGLGEVVEVVHGWIEDLTPRRVDFAFSELLNADPFREGVMEAMDAAAAWEGRCSPTRLRVRAALARAPDAAWESRTAVAQVRALGARYELQTGAIERCLDVQRASISISANEEPAGPSVMVWDLPICAGQRPEPRTLTLIAAEPGPIAGVMVWFEADLDEGIVLTNAPGTATHWGRLLCSFADERGVRAGAELRVRFSVVNRALEATLL